MTPLQPKGFQLSFTTRFFCGKPEAELTHPDFPSFFARVWVPSAYDENPLNTRYVRTLVPIDGEEIELDIDCRSLVDRCTLIGSRIGLEELKNACQSNSLESFIQTHLKPIDAEKFCYQCISLGMPLTIKELNAACKTMGGEFIRKMERILSWERYLACCVKEFEVQLLAEYLHQNLPLWEKLRGNSLGIWIPETKYFRYPFEVLANGNIWIFFTYQFLEEIQSLAINLQIGEICQWLRFEEAVGKKVRKFSPLFQKNPGLPLFFDFFLRPEGKNQIYVCKCALHDSTLYKHKKFPPPQKLRIASQLLRGLEILEKEGIVHCGIFPSSILLFWNEKDEVDAELSNFEQAHFTDELPSNFLVPVKWRKYIPPETSIGEYPFAIPIRQLGLCFQELFGEKPPLPIAAMIDGMTQEKPEKRWSASLALQALADPLSSSP